jgi:hypothetical protein
MLQDGDLVHVAMPRTQRVDAERVLGSPKADSEG